MDNQKMLETAQAKIDEALYTTAANGSVFALQGIGLALIAIGNALDGQRPAEQPPTGHQAMTYATKQVIALQTQRDGLVAERDALATALEDAFVLQGCGHPRACIARDKM